MPKLSKAEKLKHCEGCRDDFYNGKNDLGVKECWLLAGAKLLLKKEIHVDQRPPWEQAARKFLSCYRRPRHVYVEPHQEH